MIVAHSFGVKASLTVMLIVSLEPVPNVEVSEPTAPETNIAFAAEAVAVIVPVVSVVSNRAAIKLSEVTLLALSITVPPAMVIARSLSSV